MSRALQFSQLSPGRQIPVRLYQSTNYRQTENSVRQDAERKNLRGRIPAGSTIDFQNWGNCNILSVARQAGSKGPVRRLMADPKRRR